VHAAKLERLNDILRNAPRRRGAPILTDASRESLGWKPAEAIQILRGLGFRPVRGVDAGEPMAWRRPQSKRVEAPTEAKSPSQFAVLQTLRISPGRKSRQRRRSRAARG
jgi:ATP-dependent RNA helicase SUPV3L1/SUV3